jgi:hypothetical protein
MWRIVGPLLENARPNVVTLDELYYRLYPRPDHVASTVFTESLFGLLTKAPAVAKTEEFDA